MFPLRDDLRPYRRPIATWFLISITSLVFLLQCLESSNQPSMVERLGFFPIRISEPTHPVTVVEYYATDPIKGGVLESVERPAADPWVLPWVTLLTAMFLHAGFIHFAVNMWFLHIFGDNVEDSFGRVNYLILYILSGVIASLAHWWSMPMSQMPLVGASGAIAGVMGSYVRLFPRARITTLIPLPFFWRTIILPAPLFLGIWFTLQLFQGIASVGNIEMAGVAWWAHIGGFATGYLFARVFLMLHGQRIPYP